jgi:hypothetical protein
MTAAPDAVDGLQAFLTGFRANVIGKLSAPTQAAWDAFAKSAIDNDAEPLLNALIVSTAKRMLGGLFGGIAAPGVEKSADALSLEVEQDLTATETGQ